MNPIAVGFALGWLVLTAFALRWASGSRNVWVWLAKNFLLLLLALNVAVTMFVALSSPNLTPDALPNNVVGLDLLVSLAGGIPIVLLLLTVTAVTPRVQQQYRRVAAVAVFTLLSAGFAAIVFGISHENNRLANSLILIPAGIAAGLLVRLPGVADDPGSRSGELS